MSARSKGKRRAVPQPDEDPDSDDDKPVAPPRTSRKKRAAPPPPTESRKSADEDDASGSVAASGDGDANAAKRRRVQDKCNTWAPGQWEAYVKYRDQELESNKQRASDQKKKLIQIDQEFNSVERANGWCVHTSAAIRAQKGRMGEADVAYNANRLSDTDRTRARQLYEELGSWKAAADAFNQEFGRTYNANSLQQVVIRAKPEFVQDADDQGQIRSTTKRPWTDIEIEELKEYTNLPASRFGEAYEEFTTAMQAKQPDYQKRTWRGFYTQLNQVPRAIVESGSEQTGLGRVWTREKDAEFDKRAAGFSSMTAFVKAAAVHFGCAGPFLRQRHRQRKPPLRWQLPDDWAGQTAGRVSQQQQEGMEEVEVPAVGTDARRRPELRASEDDDVGRGMYTPSCGSPDYQVEEGERDAQPTLDVNPHSARALSLVQVEESSVAVAILNLARCDKVSVSPTTPALATTVCDTDRVDSSGVGGTSITHDTDRVEPGEVDDGDTLSIARSAVDAMITRVEKMAQSSTTSPQDHPGGPSGTCPIDQVLLATDEQQSSSFTGGAGDDIDSMTSPLGWDEWKALRGFTVQTPWIFEPSTPRQDDDTDRIGGENYAPHRWAYDPDDAALSEPADEESKRNSHDEEVGSRDDEGGGEDDSKVTNGSVSELCKYNELHGVPVRELRWHQRRIVIRSTREIFTPLVDELLDSATRDPDRRMDAGPLYNRLLQEWTQAQGDARNAGDRTWGSQVKNPTLTLWWL